MKTPAGVAHNHASAGRAKANESRAPVVKEARHRARGKADARRKNHDKAQNACAGTRVRPNAPHLPSGLAGQPNVRREPASGDGILSSAAHNPATATTGLPPVRPNGRARPSACRARSLASNHSRGYAPLPSSASYSTTLPYLGFQAETWASLSSSSSRATL